jgi:hypothetical protein
VLRIFDYEDFLPSVRKLRQRGGSFGRAAERIMACVGRLKSGDLDALDELTVTNSGESRIKHCVKYDMTGRSRLITIQDSNVIALCFAGVHDDADEWLESHRGMVLTADGQLQLGRVYSSGLDPQVRLHPKTDLSDGLLYKKISERYFDRICQGVPRSIVRKFEKLESTASDDLILELAAEIEPEGLPDLFYNVFTLLRRGDLREAKERIDYHLKDLSELSELDETEKAELSPGEGFGEISPEVFEHFVRTADYQKWMLYLHPGQHELVDIDYDGPATISGVSGSGKTCVVVKRAIRLATKYPHDRILIATINRPLAAMISDLIEHASTSDSSERIEVLSFWQLCQKLLSEYEPERMFPELTEKHNEHYSEIWRQFYQCEENNDDAEVLRPIHSSLLSRGICPADYLNQEFDYIRSSQAPDQRGDYLAMQRLGRVVPFDEAWRRRLLEGLKGWEDKMEFVGVTDYIGLATSLSAHIDSIEARYRCILIDEVQDFGTLELSILRKLASSRENDLFLCGDAVQKVQVKHQQLNAAGIEVGSRSRRINRNYRNSREILTAAHHILATNMNGGMADSEVEIVDPEYANFSSSRPLLLKADSAEDELGFALTFMRERYSQNEEQGKGCIAVCGLNILQIRELGEQLGIPVLDGERGIGDESLFFSELEQTKGFEFDTMCVLRCTSDYLPHGELPDEESYRDLFRFYVAMTRAKLELILSYSGERSRFLSDAEEVLVAESWDEHCEAQQHGLRFNELKRIDERPADYRMTGREFLYTRQAIGMSTRLQEKLLQLVDGRERFDERRHQVGWKTIVDVLRSRDTPTLSRLFGAETYKEFREVFQG